LRLAFARWYLTNAINSNSELRTPLTGLIGCCDLLRETPLSKQQNSYLETMRACSEMVWLEQQPIRMQSLCFWVKEISDNLFVDFFLSFSCF
jgi:signal transduction histidine kinase